MSDIQPKVYVVFADMSAGRQFAAFLTEAEALQEARRRWPQRDPRANYFAAHFHLPTEKQSVVAVLVDKLLEGT